MTIIQKLKQLYPNHHHRVQPKPNTAPLTAEETIYQCHVRPKDVKEDTLWELVAEGLHKDVHAQLDGMQQRRATSVVEDEHDDPYMING